MASTAIRYDIIARDHASRTFDRVGRSASTTDKMLAKLGRTAKIAGEALAVGLAVGLAESVKQATEFQSSMTKIATQAGGTAKDVKQLSDQVLKLGTHAQQDPKELADSLYHLKSVGMDNVSAMKALKEASDLAAVGGSSLEETTNALAGAWRTGIKGAGSFHEAVSTVNAIIGAGNMRMEQFTEAIGTGILPSAKTFGLSLKQVGAALALMTDEGVPAVDAATRLRMTFSLLGAPSGAAEKQLKKIGITGLDLAKAMRGKDGLIGAVQLLKTHLDKSGMSAEQQSQVLSRAFGGGRSSSAILTLVNNLDVLKKKQEQVNKTTGRFDGAVRMQRKTAEAQWKLLVSNLEVMSVRVGTKVLPPLTHFVEWLNTKAMPAAHDFGKVMGRVVPVGDIKRSIAQAKTLVGDFFTGLQGKAVVNVATPSVDKAPVMTMPKSASAQLGQQLHDAIAGGFKDIDWGNLGKVVGEGLGSAFQWIVKNGAKLTKQLGQALGGLDWVNVGKELGKVALPFAIGFINNLFEPMMHKDFWKKHWLDTILAALSVIPVGKLGGVIGKLGSKIPWGKLGEAFSKIPWSKLIPFGKKIAEAAGPIFLKINEFVGKIALKLIEAFARRFPRVAAWFVRELALLPTRLGVIAIEMGQKGAQMVARLGKGLLDHIPGASNRFIRAALKAFGRFSLYQTGLNLAQSLLSGAWSVLKGVGSWMKHHLVDPVVHWVKSGFGIASPSKVFTGIGRNLVAGLKSGILNAIAGVGKWLGSHVVSPITSRFSKASGWLQAAGGSLISGLVSGTWSWLGQKGHSFKSWATSIKGKIVGAIVDVFKIGSPSKVMMTYGGHIMSGLWHGMLQGKDTLHAVAKGLFKTPLEAAENMFKNGASIGGKWLAKVGGSLGLGDSSATTGAQQFAQLAMKSYGWGPAEWPALKALWNRESSWSYTATNPTSGAYGIPQALPASKMASAGKDWRTNPDTQIRWGLGYIKGRYGSPSAAWAHEGKFNWYAKGTDGAARGLAWVGEKGPELVSFKGGETVWNNADSMSLAQAHGIALPGYAKGTKSAKNATEVKSIANQLANGFLKQLATGTASAIASVLKSLTSKLLNAGYNHLAKSVLKAGGKLESLANKRASIQKRIAAANQYAADQSSNIRDFLSISGTSATSVGALISQMGSQQKTASSFVTLSKSLKARGASKALLQQLSDAGPGSQLATILGDKGVTTQDIAKLNKLTASGSKLATGFGKSMADLMYDTGKHAGEGFLAGLKATEKSLQKQINKLANDLVKAIKKALKIKSPSGVFRDEIGKQVVLGWVAGMDAHGHLVGASAQRLADTATGVSLRRRYVPTAAAPSRAGGDEVWERVATALERFEGTDVHVHFDDERLKDLIDIRVKPKIKASEDRQAFRAKVGRR
ncbi:phage tail tape measure protein [Streptomyces sp. NPDC002758]